MKPLNMRPNETSSFLFTFCGLDGCGKTTMLTRLEKELGELGIGSWTKPYGGYFISFDAMEGCAKAIVAKCKEAGVTMTGAGATYPYGKDPADSILRIAPTFAPVSELPEAMEIFCLSAKLASLEKLLG